VARTSVPVRGLLTSEGLPPSPPALAGSVPRSRNVAPPSVERAQPVAWLPPTVKLPVSSKATTTVLAVAPSVRAVVL
jgi:hypothetical protein